MTPPDDEAPRALAVRLSDVPRWSHPLPLRPDPLPTLPSDSVSGDTKLVDACAVTTYMRKPQAGEEGKIEDARYIIGSWWIDEVTNPYVVFVCHKECSGRWVHMDRCLTLDEARDWSMHYRDKQWKRWDDTDLFVLMRDLETAMVLAAHLQSIRDKQRPRRRPRGG
jgi:hypothetical protein